MRAGLARVYARKEELRVSASSRSGTRIGDEDGPGGFAGALWLARWEIKRTWPSYVLGGLFLLFCGFLVVPGLSGIFEFRGFGPGGGRIEDLYNDFLADTFFLGVCAFLAVNALVRRDAYSLRLLLLRELPISAASVVAGRAISMLLALSINGLAFFLPAYLLTDFGDLGVSYLWFAGVWIGYSLFASGFYLLLGFTTNGEAYAPISVGAVLALVVFVALLELTTDLGLVGRTVELVRAYGVLPAVFSVLVGAVSFVLLARATVLRIQRREVLGEPFA